MPKSQIRRMILAATTACEEKKAEDIRVLELDPIDSAFTDFFLLCSGSNPRQNQAIAQEIELRLKREFGAYANSVEGYRQAEWILLDYVDFVVHIFAADKRAFYDIERLRKSANSVALDDLKKSLV
ncbi:MAG TPA: ribosome silencing factor, partial [Acidobacteriaceae bacterium]|nr:ribosome silencing factor [Acidobacteriaceae bacterium]